MKDKFSPVGSFAGGRMPSVVANSLAERLGPKLTRYCEAGYVDGLSSYQAFELIGEIDAKIASLMALRARAVVKAVGDKPVAASTVRKGSDVSLEDVRSSELGAYLRISPLAARNMAEVCRDLVRWLPRTMSNLEVGNIDEPKARIVAEGAHQIYTNLLLIDPEIKGLQDGRVMEMMIRFENLVTRNMARRTRSEIRLAVKRAIAHLTPVAEETRHQVGRQERSVEFFDNGYGMTLMQALMTNLDAAKLKNVLEYCAKNDESLSGNMMQKMSDALVGIMTGDTDIDPERRLRAAQVNVVVSLETLLGISDAPASVVGSDFALTANQVRELSNDSHLRRMVVDPTSGALLELGRRSYEPSKQVKDFVKLRDKKCRAPGCVRNAMRCDVDHVKAWDDGGETNVDNLVSLCRRHHVLKTIGTWQYELKPNGDTVWRLPNGQVVTDYADTWTSCEPDTKPVIVPDFVPSDLVEEPIPF